MPDQTSNSNLRNLVLTALFGATGAAGGYMLMFIPNVEIITALMFLSGYVLGIRNGIIASIIACFLYFGLNPQGGIYPPLLLSQMLGMAASPVLGATLKKTLRKYSEKILIQMFFLTISAIITTLLYDLLTNLSFPLSSGMGMKGIISTLILGIPLSGLHILSNVVVFLIVVPVLLRLVEKHI